MISIIDWEEIYEEIRKGESKTYNGYSKENGTPYYLSDKGIYFGSYEEYIKYNKKK